MRGWRSGPMGPLELIWLNTGIGDLPKPALNRQAGPASVVRTEASSRLSVIQANRHSERASSSGRSTGFEPSEGGRNTARSLGLPTQRHQGIGMPIYFFHIRGRDQFVRDLEGMDLPDLDAVRIEAREAAREIMAAGVRQGGEPDQRGFQVETEDGRTVLDYPFQEALDRKFH